MFAAISLGFFVGQTAELNTFLYKHYFGIPPHTHLMAARTTFSAVLPIPFIANLFAMTQNAQQPFTLHSKLVLLITLTDTLFSIKFGTFIFAHLDLWMVALWIVSIVVLSYVCVALRSFRALLTPTTSASSATVTPPVVAPPTVVAPPQCSQPLSCEDQVRFRPCPTT